jgi:hypothetical protein
VLQGSGADQLIGIIVTPVSSADVKWQVLREKRLSHKSLESVESPEIGSFWPHLLLSHCFVTLAVPSSFHQKLIGSKIIKWYSRRNWLKGQTLRTKENHLHAGQDGTCCWVHESAVHIRSSIRPRSKLAQFENGCRCLDWMNEQDQATTHRLARIHVGLRVLSRNLLLLFINNRQVGMTHASAVFRLDDY